MIAKTVVLALLAASVTLATPIPASSSGSSSRRSSGGSHASSRTSMSTHNQAQAQHQQHQHQQHQVHVVNAVQNQAWHPPAQPNPVNLQPLHVAGPPARPRRRPTSNCGLSCTVMKKREIVERDLQRLESRARGSTSRRSTPRSSRSSNRNSGSSHRSSHRSSRTSMSTHNQAQAQHQQHQQQQHHVHVVNAVHNQAWNPPAHQNPVNLQPLHVAQPAQRRRPRPSSGCGLSCTVMKKRALEAMELAARSFEALEARGLDELD